MYYQPTCYNLWPRDATYYDPGAADSFPLDFSEICEVSAQADMLTVTPDDIAKHLAGIALVRTFYSVHDVRHTDVISYAGLTGLVEHPDYEGKKLAVLGSIVTLPECRGRGFASLTVDKLLATASVPSNVAEIGHDGYIARCNIASKILLEKHGFTLTGESNGKSVMVKPFSDKHLQFCKKVMS